MLKSWSFPLQLVRLLTARKFLLSLPRVSKHSLSEACSLNLCVVGGKRLVNLDC
jgi:hypothetical protein